VTIAGVLLTGGASRRMGTDKAALVYGGETLAARAARVLAAVCDPVVEVGPGHTRHRAVVESPAGAGPLAALVAGADSLGADVVLLLACDMPFVEPPLLQLVADWPGDDAVVPVAAGKRQYGCARYGSDALHRARRLLAGGTASLRAVCDEGCEELPESRWRAVAPAHAFTDLDTPEDRARSIGP
jgi:molybdopterin-guanine dinucleotide biosynthesis protein A